MRVKEVLKEFADERNAKSYIEKNKGFPTAEIVKAFGIVYPYTFKLIIDDLLIRNIKNKVK